MERKRRAFTREFKLEAVRLLHENGHTVAAVARDLGINGTMRVLPRYQGRLR
jgi:transposase-like protein